MCIIVLAMVEFSDILKRIEKYFTLIATIISFMLFNFSIQHTLITTFQNTTTKTSNITFIQDNTISTISNTIKLYLHNKSSNIYPTSTKKAVFKKPITSTSLYHAGNVEIQHDVLISEIKYVLNTLPNITYTKNLKILLAETAFIESRFGKFLTPFISNATYTGVYQIKISTAKDTLKWLYKTDIKTYEILKTFYWSDKTLYYNLKHNVTYSIALATIYYQRMCPNLYDLITTKYDRAKLYAKIYNTLNTKQIIDKYITLSKELSKRNVKL